MTEKCPEMKTIRADDESLDICKLDNSICSLVCNNECVIYNEYLEEEALEEARLLLGVD